MTKQTLHNKRYAHEYAYIHNDMEKCNCILAELEAENFHILVSLLRDYEWQAAYEWIEENM